MNKQILKMQQSVEAKHCPFARQRSFSIFPVRCNCCKKFGGVQSSSLAWHMVWFSESPETNQSHLSIIVRLPGNDMQVRTSSNIWRMQITAVQRQTTHSCP